MVTIVNTALHVSMLSRKQIFRVLIHKKNNSGNCAWWQIETSCSVTPAHTQTLDHHAAQLQLTYHAPLCLHRRAISARGNPNAWGQQTHTRRNRMQEDSRRARLPLFFSPVGRLHLYRMMHLKTEDTWLLALHTLKAFGNTDEDSQEIPKPSFRECLWGPPWWSSG